MNRERIILEYILLQYQLQMNIVCKATNKSTNTKIFTILKDNICMFSRFMHIKCEIVDEGDVRVIRTRKDAGPASHYRLTKLSPL